jgi:RimJ/RimL family protein N-acetyltransferase
MPNERPAAIELRPLTSRDRDAAIDVVNEAAQWYREFLPPGHGDGPEMTPESWDAEARRMAWHGAFVDGVLVGVMGLEYVKEVALLRHAYVVPEHQRSGIGSQLLEHLERQVRGVDRIVIGTYVANYKARAALEKSGYEPSPDPEPVLRRYFEIPEDRLRTSLTYEKRVAARG